MISYKQASQKILFTARTSAIATFFVLPISTSATIALFMLTTLLTALSGQWAEKLSLIKSNPIALYFIGFFLLYILGITYSIGSAADIKHQLIKSSWMLLAPLWIPLFIEEKWRQRGIQAFLLSMTITLALSYAKYFHWISNPYFWSFLSHRFSGSLASVFKDYLVQSFLMSLAAIIFLHRFITQKRWAYAILFLLAAGHIFFISKARTDYIIFTLLLTYCLFSQLSLKKALIICIASIASLAILLTALPGSIHKRIYQAAQDIQQWNKGQEKTSLGYRIAWQQNALRLIKHRHLVGYGTGSIKAAFATLPKKYTQQTGIVDNTSNEYLNTAMQFGLIGLLIFLGMLLMQWRYSFFLDKEQKLLVQSLLIALCVGNLANSWIMDFTQGHYFAMTMMLAFAALSKRPKPSTVKDPACNDDAATDTLA